MKAIEVQAFGTSDELAVVERETPEPGEGEVRVEVEAAGINFADIMQRRGHYEGGPEPTYVPGMEAAGTIDAVGEGVGLDEGDRVVAMTNGGAYAEYAIADPQSLFPIPDGMSFEEAAGFPVQFLTAHGCLFEWGGLEEGERVLIQAAAGGVGTAAVQLASRAGAEVFGTASTEEKLDLAERLGCDHPIQYTEEDFVDEVHEITDGEGVDLVLDGVGGETFSDSLDAIPQFGRIVAYGAASGRPGEVDTGTLLFGNKSVIGYHLGRAMVEDPNRVLKAVPDLQEGLQSGELEVIVGESFALEDAAEAHQFIEDRGSTGKVVLTP
ncbi:NADPH:quinone oxidoreductase family protein [Halostella sp. JP-L12]|uniref:quinone oxidoreductase family protein n=1 Tax=Halostella TaxID=1843185 RepID=UPI000EF77261|nr:MULTISPECIES: NADPH:quinone oxidoreductase family protein [Halostella]NHN48512.1 NADPH:quinone oxidoreductase family protein [Halostella sp. JP-L12]